MSVSISTTRPGENVSCRRENVAEHGGLQDYYTDESRKTGIEPEVIYFPTCTAEVSAALAEISKRGEKVTVSGARTGIAGGAVSAAGNLISLEMLKKPVEFSRLPDGTWSAKVAAGLSLSELYEAVRTTGPNGYFYPVDPTETSASVGGTIATNASGARTLKYGPTRNWVLGLTAVLADGAVVEMRRGEYEIVEGPLELTENGRSRGEHHLMPVTIPATKHTAGYYIAEGMDPIELLIGGEGTLCIITEADLKLSVTPGVRLSLVLFLPEDRPSGIVSELLSLEPAAIEYMDSRSLELLRKAKAADEDTGAVPDMPEDARAALYIELEGADDDAIDELYTRLEMILETHSIPEDHTWAGFEESDLEGMKKFRHALPERINTIIGQRKKDIPELTKVGTDMAVPIEALDAMLSEYSCGLSRAGLEYCVFGHIGNAHLHVNILPNSMEEVDIAYELYGSFAAKAVALGGSVAGEHGIGRLKKRFMDIQYSEFELVSMKATRSYFDPDGVLNPGVMFDI